MSDNNELKKKAENGEDLDHLSLNDDRRVKVLSPGAMVAKRFFRNRIAVVGMATLIFMFLFSFVGGLITPYSEAQQFYRMDMQNKQYAGVTLNSEFRFAVNEGQDFNSVLQAQMTLAMLQNKDSFTYRDVSYDVTEEGKDLYSVTYSGKNTVLAIAYKDIISSSVQGSSVPFALQYGALKAYTNDETSFTVDGTAYTID